MRHSNVDPASDDVKLYVGVSSLIRPDGPEVIVVIGATVSTVKDRDAGDGSTLPAVSVARTSNVWAPSVSTAVASGELQATNAALSTRHSNVEPCWSAMNVNVGVASVPNPNGPSVMVVS